MSHLGISSADELLSSNLVTVDFRHGRDNHSNERNVGDSAAEAVETVNSVTRNCHFDSDSTSDSSDGAEKRFVLLHWLPVRSRITYKIGTLMRNVHAGKSSDYIFNIVQPTSATSHILVCDHLPRLPAMLHRGCIRNSESRRSFSPDLLYLTAFLHIYEVLQILTFSKTSLRHTC